jgi:hypothetical protein
VALEKSVLSENNRIAAELREALRATGALALNFISSPGSGKTALLEKTLELLPRPTSAVVLTGDIQTDKDAQRLLRYGYPVRQITTGGACHLDAAMVEDHLRGWPEQDFEFLLIENVGNLVCPTSYDLGEDAKIVRLYTAPVGEILQRHFSNPGDAGTVSGADRRCRGQSPQAGAGLAAVSGLHRLLGVDVAFEPSRCRRGSCWICFRGSTTK